MRVELLLSALVVGAALGGPACTQTEGQEPVTRTATRAVDDAWIETKIQARYFVDSDVTGRDISVTAKSGVVALRGYVPDERARRQAVSIAQSTEGVKRVDDRLTVRTGDESDLAHEVGDVWITTKIQAQYFTDPAIKASAIDVTTADGVVTLKGDVSSRQAERGALSVARATKGVKQVIDRLTVRVVGRPGF